MKTIVKFKCEICQKEYAEPEDALTCENQGFANVGDERFPIGLMYPYYHHDFVGIFAIAEKTVATYSSHHVEFSSWAARTPRYPPGVQDKKMGPRCAGGNDRLKSVDQWCHYYAIRPEHQTCPEFKTMVEALRVNGIQPSYYTPEGTLIRM